MNKNIFLLIFLFLSKLGLSQIPDNVKLNHAENDRLFYIDSSQVSTLSQNFKYYRLIKDYKLDKDMYTVLDYDRAGVLRMKKTTKNKEGHRIDGEVTYYYENGKIESQTNYAKGRANGKSTLWYENGTKKLEAEYIVDKENKTTQKKINQFWDENGIQKVVDGNGLFEDKGENETSRGEIKNGLPEGVWEGSFFKSSSTYKETYKDGKLISGESRDSKNNSYKYTKVRKKPEHKGSIAEFYKYVAKNYRIPTMAKGETGKVYMTFVVNKNGIVVEPKILKDIGYGTGDEALRILKGYAGFNPGELRGQKIDVSYSLPINIKSSK